MIGTDILQRVFFIATENDTGTAFTMEHNDIQYLVSAKHIFEDLENDDIFENGNIVEFNIFHDSKWKKIELKGLIHYIEDIDMIVFPLKNDLSPRNKLQISFTEMRVSQDIFFLGFPYGMYTQDIKSVNNHFPIPFVKKGILSAFDHNEITGSIGYLDGHTNPGFSGGPIVYKTIDTNETTIAGIMRGYVIHGGKVDFEEIDDDGKMTLEQFDYDENSGIIEFQNIKHFYEILE